MLYSYTYTYVLIFLDFTINHEIFALLFMGDKKITAQEVVEALDTKER
jgi:hypothetical protein